MDPGSNGPAIVNGGVNSYDRPVALDAPIEFDSGLFSDPNLKTLATLREEMMVRMGYAAMLANPPPGMTQELNSYLQDANEQMYTRYPDLRLERWWAWQLSQGRRFYDVPIDGTDYLDLHRVTWAGLTDNGGRILRGWFASTAYALGEYVAPSSISTATTYTAAPDIEYEVTVAGTSDAAEPTWPTTIGDTVVSGTVTFTARARATPTWHTIQQGIDPIGFGLEVQDMPRQFNLGQYVEVWPEPDKTYVLWLRGHLGVRRFTEDADKPTVDSRLVLLFALANAKAFRGQADARNYADMANRRVRDLVALSHGARRYIPRESTAGMGPEREAQWPMPKATFR